MSLLSRRRALMSQNKEKYVFVEYIESTGTQWIDTGVIANGNTKVDIDFQLVELYASFLFGSRTTTRVDAYTFNIGSSANAGYLISSYGQSPVQQIVKPDTLRHTVMKNCEQLYYDGKLKNQVDKETFTSPDSLELFACYSNGAKGCLPSKMKLYSCTIYDGVLEGSRTLLRKFIPCYRKADGVGGLYDTVSDMFFENQGTGEFIIGGEI